MLLEHEQNSNQTRPSLTTKSVPNNFSGTRLGPPRHEDSPCLFT